MMLSEKCQRKVEENIGLVHGVLHDRLHPPYQVGMYSYDDLFQIGCIGLCKAAATDKGGTFSTYAYRLIWNEICDAMIYAARRQANESACDVTPFVAAEQAVPEELSVFYIDIEKVLAAAKAEAPPSTGKGIDAMWLHFEFISIILMLNDGDFNRFDGDRFSICTIKIFIWI